MEAATLLPFATVGAAVVGAAATLTVGNLTRRQKRRALHAEKQLARLTEFWQAACHLGHVLHEEEDTLQSALALESAWWRLTPLIPEELRAPAEPLFKLANEAVDIELYADEVSKPGLRNEFGKQVVELREAFQKPMNAWVNGRRPGA